jgi:hypothetical protein
MVGALMQLVAYGAQDIFLNGNGNQNEYKPKFRIYYRKHIIGDIVVKFEIYNVEFLGFEWVKFTSNSQCVNIFDFGYKAINCEKCLLNKLPKFKSIDEFKKMKYLNCSINKLDNINKLMYSNELIWLNSSYNKLKTIPEKIYSLEYFDFSNNGVEGNVDFLMYPNLKYLMVSSNQIKSVSNLPNDLAYLDLSNNPITELEVLPCGLKYLLIVQTKIKSINLIELENLEYLDISINDLNTQCLDGLPSSLTYLNCSQCGISGLNNLPTSLTKLICINNEIKTLDMLPESLEYLDCDHNKITKLDNLPNSLNKLICSNNLITSLDNLPANLTELNCEINNIQQLKNLPPKLKKSNIKYTKLKNDDNNCSVPQITFFKQTYKRYTDFEFTKKQTKYFNKANKYMFKNMRR